MSNTLKWHDTSYNISLGAVGGEPPSDFGKSPSGSSPNRKPLGEMRRSV